MFLSSSLWSHKMLYTTSWWSDFQWLFKYHLLLEFSVRRLYSAGLHFFVLHMFHSPVSTPTVLAHKPKSTAQIFSRLTRSDFDRDKTFTNKLASFEQQGSCLLQTEDHYTQQRTGAMACFPPRLLCLPQDVLWPWNRFSSNGRTAWRKLMYRETGSWWTGDRVHQLNDCRAADLKKSPQVMLGFCWI